MNLQIPRLVASALIFAAAARGAEYLVYAGSAAGDGKGGIYGFRFDARSARLKALGQVARLASPAFLLEHPDHRYLYALSAEAGGSLSAFLIDPRNGKLALVNQVPSGGNHLALDREGRWLAVSNGAGGSIAILPLRKDGGIGAAQAPVSLPNPRHVLFAPDNRFLLAAGEQRIYIYHFDVATGALSPAEIPYVEAAESGVRHLEFHPKAPVLYASDRKRPGVTAYRYNPDSGELSFIEDSPASAPPSAHSEDRGDLTVNPAGTVVYVSIAGSDSMALFAVDPVRFTLGQLEITPLVGRTPSDFALDPSGAWLLVANRDSNNLSVYTVHPHTGQLRPTGRPSPPIEHPAWLAIVPK